MANNFHKTGFSASCQVLQVVFTFAQNKKTDKTKKDKNPIDDNDWQLHKLQGKRYKCIFEYVRANFWRSACACA